MTATTTKGKVLGDCGGDGGGDRMFSGSLLGIRELGMKTEFWIELPLPYYLEPHLAISFCTLT